MSISKLISILFHPIFMPFIGFLLSIYYIPELIFNIKGNLNLIYLSVFFYTIFLPLISIFFLLKTQHIISLEMTNKKERVVPLLITFFCLSLGYFSLENLLLFNPILKAEYIGVMTIIGVGCLVSNFWKISLHMLGAGGFLGMLIGLHFLFENILHLILLAFLLSGILASARLKEKAHTKTQLYFGFFIGLFIEVFIMLNY